MKFFDNIGTSIQRLTVETSEDAKTVKKWRERCVSFQGRLRKKRVVVQRAYIRGKQRTMVLARIAHNMQIQILRAEKKKARLVRHRGTRLLISHVRNIAVCCVACIYPLYSLVVMSFSWSFGRINWILSRIWISLISLILSVLGRRGKYSARFSDSSACYIVPRELLIAYVCLRNVSTDVWISAVRWDELTRFRHRLGWTG